MKQSKTKPYAIMTNSGAVVVYKKSKSEALNYFNNEGYIVTLKDIYIYNK